MFPKALLFCGGSPPAAARAEIVKPPGCCEEARNISAMEKFILERLPVRIKIGRWMKRNSNMQLGVSILPMLSYLRCLLAVVLKQPRLPILPLCFRFDGAFARHLLPTGPPFRIFPVWTTKDTDAKGSCRSFFVVSYGIFQRLYPNRGWQEKWALVYLGGGVNKW